MRNVLPLQIGVVRLLQNADNATGVNGKPANDGTRGSPMKLSLTVMANKILDRLNEYDNRYRFLNTLELMLPIFDAMGLKNTAANLHNSRRCLDRLHSAGHVVRSGEGKFKFKISENARINGWDKSFPFIGADGKQADEPVPSKDRTDADMIDDGTDDEVPVVDASSVSAVPNEQIESLKRRVAELERNEKLIRVELVEKEDRIDKIEKLAAAANSVRTIKIEKYDGKTYTLKNVILPSYFQTVLDLAKQRRNILLVGPAGCGKTTVAGLIARTMGLKFGKIGGTGGLTEAHLLGTKTTNISKGTWTFQPAEFVIRFEQGGIMLIDELDGADQNVLLCLNSALDRSEELSLPNRIGKTVAKKHKDFICIATANTFGTGNSRIYAGRNQLDGSTLSRFQIGIIECYYDRVVEQGIVASMGGDEVLLNRIWDIRRKAEESILRRVIDTRFIEDAYLMKTTANWSDDKIVGQLLQGWSRDERSKVGEAALSV